MKGVQGIKAFAVCAIVINSVYLVFLAFLAFSGNTAKGAFYLTMYLLFAVLDAVSILYAVQLLLMQKNYYRYIPIAPITRRLLHVSRILQLGFSVLLIVMLVSAIGDIYLSLDKGLGRKYYSIMGNVIFLIALGVTLNLILFFKGWRLLKQTRTNYIDEVMASFDDAALPKQ